MLLKYRGSLRSQLCVALLVSALHACCRKITESVVCCQFHTDISILSEHGQVEFGMMVMIQPFQIFEICSKKNIIL